MTAAQTIRLVKRLRTATYWLAALGLVLLIGGQNLRAAWDTAGERMAALLGPDDIATEQLIADDIAPDDRAAAEQAERQAAQWRHQVRQAIRLACRPHAGRLNRDGDIQCVDADGQPVFFAYRWQP